MKFYELCYGVYEHCNISSIEQVIINIHCVRYGTLLEFEVVINRLIN